ncbi:hypothetical protein ACIB24_03435 [Spongisporangium articulatum]|uniref:Uncharacterized protein n=1 Tax=Spongisporangium articulatum TaxID=3362603 RepID=A0ABW8AIC2_9ACTN
MSWDDAEDVQYPYSPQTFRDDIDELSAMLRGLAPRVAGMDGRLADAEKTVLRVDRRSLEVETSHRDLVAAIRRLTSRVEWLERNVRLRGGVDAPLDDVPARLRTLARTAEQGREAADRGLDDNARRALRQAVDAHASAVHDLVAHRRAGLSACLVLASSDLDDPEHRSTAADFPILMERLDETRAHVRALAGPAVQAAQALADDERAQRDGATVVREGDEAWHELQSQLHERLKSALDTGALLPEWFVDALGPVKPLHDSERWTETAADLMAYRITYDVEDPNRSLGPPPGPDAAHSWGERRLAWHRRLSAEIHELVR